MDQGPRRIRDHGAQPAQRLSGAPFIPAAIDPDVVAAQQTAQHAGPNLRDLAPSPVRRLIAMGIDVLMIALLAAVASDFNSALPLVVVLVFGWLIIRYLPLVLLGQTPGQTLAGYEVRGPRGASLGPVRAAARDAILITGAAWVWGGLTTVLIATPDGQAPRNELDRRWPHDLITDSWVVRRDAGRS